MKRLRFVFAVVFALLFTVNAQAKVEVKNVNIGGRNANVVTVDLNKEVKLRVSKPNNKQVGTMNFKTFINNYGAKAAINGNYFEAYKGGKFPYGTQMKNGQMINMEGKNANLIVFDDYKAKIVHGTFKYFGYLDGKKKNEWNNATNAMDFNVFSVWYANVAPNDTSGVYIFNQFRNVPTNFNGGFVVTVKGDVVQKVEPGNGKAEIPKDGYLIYYGKDAADENYVKARFKPGRKVGLDLMLTKDTADGLVETSTFKYGEEEISFSKVTDIMSAAPMLIENGKSVWEKSVKGMEAKMTQGAGARSLIGINKNNQLVLVTTSGTMAQCANIMASLGCTDAFNLDGGASSALFANGRYLRNAGRQLNTVLLIQQK